jgi:hypothetical protein
MPASRRGVSAFIATAFAQDHADAAKAQRRQVADQVRTKLPKPAALLDEAEEDVLVYVAFPKEHRAKIHSTNPLERLNGEVKRRTEVVGIFPNEAAVTRLVGAILLEQNDEWSVQQAHSGPNPPRRSRPPSSYTTSRDTTRHTLCAAFFDGSRTRQRAVDVAWKIEGLFLTVPTQATSAPGEFPHVAVP